MTPLLIDQQQDQPDFLDLFIEQAEEKVRRLATGGEESAAADVHSPMTGAETMSRDPRMAVHDADMTRRVETICLTGPLHQVATQIERKMQTLGACVDGLRVCLTLIREVGLKITFDDGPDATEAKRIVRDAILEQAAVLSDDQIDRLSMDILRGLEAHGEPEGQFAVSYYDSALGSLATRRFSYLSFSRASDDSYRYSITPEAGIVYAFIADRDLDDAVQRVMDKMISEAVERGDVDRAMMLTIQAKSAAIKMMREIRSLISDLSSNPEAVLWTKDIEPRVTSANTHLNERIEQHAKLNDAVKERLEATLEDNNAEKLTAFSRLIENEANELMRLLGEVRTASERFRNHQARAFALRPTGSSLHPDDVFRLLLDARSELATASADVLLPRIFPPAVEDMRIFDLDRFFRSMEKALSSEKDVPARLPDVEGAIAVGGDPALEARREQAAGLALKSVLSRQDRVSLSKIIREAEELCGSETARIVGYLCMAIASQSPRAIGYTASIDGSFSSSVMRGDDIVFERVEA